MLVRARAHVSVPVRVARTQNRYITRTRARTCTCARAVRVHRRVHVTRQPARTPTLRHHRLIIVMMIDDGYGDHVWFVPCMTVSTTVLKQGSELPLLVPCDRRMASSIGKPAPDM